MQSKELSPAGIAASVPDDAVLVFTSDASLMVCDAIFAAIEKRFLETGHPRNLTLIQPCNGFLGVGTGIDRFMHQGLAATLITSILPPNKDSQTHKLHDDGHLDLVLLPMGMLYSWLRENAAGRPGLITSVGTGTFVEESVGRQIRIGGRPRTLLDRVTIDGQSYLHLKPLNVDIAFVRATSADARANLSLERAQLVLDPMAVALSGKCGKGRVYAQVERLVPEVQPAKEVAVPGIFIEGFCVVPDAAHSIYGGYDAALANDEASPPDAVEQLDTVREVILRRAIREIPDHAIVNLGVGMGAYVPGQMRMTADAPLCTFVTEHGAVGGTPVGDVNLFGVHRNAEALINPSDMFAAYTGGLIDISILGFAQVDAAANVNVSRFSGRSNGPGGFIDISSNARKLIFCGTFTAGGLKVEAADGKLRILQEGKVRKFVEEVEEVTYSSQALKGTSNRLLFITERCVLEHHGGRWLLKDVTPGIRIEDDILALLPFDVAVADDCLSVRSPMLAAGVS